MMFYVLTCIASLAGKTTSVTTLVAIATKMAVIWGPGSNIHTLDIDHHETYKQKTNKCRQFQ